jgi:hypothetical protein
LNLPYGAGHDFPAWIITRKSRNGQAIGQGYAKGICADQRFVGVNLLGWPRQILVIGEHTYEKQEDKANLN